MEAAKRISSVILMKIDSTKMAISTISNRMIKSWHLLKNTMAAARITKMMDESTYLYYHLKSGSRIKLEMMKEPITVSVAPSSLTVKVK